LEEPKTGKKVGERWLSFSIFQTPFKTQTNKHIYKSTSPLFVCSFFCLSVVSVRDVHPMGE